MPNRMATQTPTHQTTLVATMTPDEFRSRMQTMANGGNYDNEQAHGDADDLMCEALRSLGYGEGVDIYQSIEKWYA